MYGNLDVHLFLFLYTYSVSYVCAKNHFIIINKEKLKLSALYNLFD